MPHKNFHKQLLDNICDGVYFVDLNRTITYWNKSAERLTGYAASEVVGRCCADNILMHVNDEGERLCFGMCPLLETMRDGAIHEAQVYLHHKHGHRVPILVRVSPLHDEAGEIVGAVEIFSDRSAQLQDQKHIESLRRLALLCPLTELGNRRYAEIKMTDKLSELERYDWPFCLLFIDIDHFKQVNDKYGHPMGDETLRMVARTIANSVRAIDFVGRWGGEEFIALLSNVDPATASTIAERCRMLVEESQIRLNGNGIRVTVSIGATMGRAGDTVSTLVSRADALLYVSKSAGRNRVTFGD